MELHLHSYQLPLKDTFRISRESRDVQGTMIVELRSDGLSGFGEATENPYYGVTIQKMMDQLEMVRPVIEGTPVGDPVVFWHQMEPHLKELPFAQCALDMAMNDLYARKKGKPLYEVWGLELGNMPPTNYTIGIASIPEMVRKMKAMPWPLYKIKLGTSEDLEIIRALRAETDAIFRVDANCGWTAEQTIELGPQLKELGVEFIEQPLKADDWDGLKEVYAKSVLPIIADESCIVETDVAKCHNHFHGINIKLTKCGGLTPARQMIREAKELGMQVMVGCMTESSVGISAIAHLLPLLDYVDMDGALLLSEDIAEGVCIDDGVVHFPKAPGTGVKLIK